MIAQKMLVRKIFGGLIAIGLLSLAAINLLAQTQSAMNQDACAQYKQADQALNAAYNKILKDYAKDPQFLAKLKQAQRAWIAFRDAQLEARFPQGRQTIRIWQCLSDLSLQLTHGAHRAAYERTQSLG